MVTKFMARAACCICLVVFGATLFSSSALADGTTSTTSTTTTTPTPAPVSEPTSVGGGQGLFITPQSSDFNTLALTPDDNSVDELVDEVEAVAKGSSLVGISYGGCPGTYVCAFDSTNYDTNNTSWAFRSQYNNFQNLDGGCYALDSGFSFNDCAKSVQNLLTRANCNGAQFWYNANYGGTSYKVPDDTGTKNLGSDSDQFSSEVACAY